MKILDCKISLEIKENRYIRRIIDSNISLAILFNLFFLTLILLFCDIKYEVSDDFVMATIMSGAYGNEPNPQMIFVNVIIGYLLLPFYKLFPGISWYFVAQILLIFVSSSTVTYFLLEKLDKERSFLLSVMFVLFFVNDAYILVQFTKTGMLGVMSGGLLFVWALFERQSIWKVLFGAVLCLAGTLARFSTIYLAGGFIIFILFYEFIQLILERGWKKLWNRYLFIIIFAGSMLIGMAFGLKWLDWYTYNNDEAYGGFSAYNSARAAIVDSKFYDYDSYAEELSAIGVSSTDFYMMKSWNFADNDVFSLEKMQQVANIIAKYHSDQELEFDDIIELLNTREYGKYPICIACIVLLCLGVFLNYEKWWTMLVSIGIGLGYLVYFCNSGRFVYRVEYSVFLGTFLCGIYFWNNDKSEKKIIKKLEGKRACIIVAVLCMISNLIIYIPDQSYKLVTSESRKSYIDNTFIASWDYGPQKYRMIVNKNKPTSGMLDEFEDNKQKFYFLDFNTTIQTLYYEWCPWESLGIGAYNNFVYLCGVTTNYPDVVELLESKALSNPLKSLVREDVYVVDNCNVELKLNYLREHYYPEARVELYKEIDGYQIWKYYEK